MRSAVMRSAVMRSAIFALAGLVLAGSLAVGQPIDGRLKIIHETATLRVAYRTDSRPFSYVDAQGRPVGYTIELCERIARSLEQQLNVALAIKWVPVDERTRFEAIINDSADMECGSTTVSLSRMQIVDFSSVVSQIAPVYWSSLAGNFFCSTTWPARISESLPAQRMSGRCAISSRDAI
jgi:ABC-type amino acid transport substrate-binding protein